MKNSFSDQRSKVISGSKVKVISRSKVKVISRSSQGHLKVEGQGHLKVEGQGHLKVEVKVISRSNVKVIPTPNVKVISRSKFKVISRKVKVMLTPDVKVKGNLNLKAKVILTPTPMPSHICSMQSADYGQYYGGFSVPSNLRCYHTGLNSLNFRISIVVNALITRATDSGGGYCKIAKNVRSILPPPSMKEFMITL